LALPLLPLLPAAAAAWGEDGDDEEEEDAEKDALDAAEAFFAAAAAVPLADSAKASAAAALAAAAGPGGGSPSDRASARHLAPQAAPEWLAWTYPRDRSLARSVGASEPTSEGKDEGAVVALGRRGGEGEREEGSPSSAIK
jgi:hypothetical protein